MENSLVALVTGGAKRIGRAVSIGLAETGYDIALHYNTSEEEARETAKEIEQLGRKCRLFRCNFTDMEEVNELIPSVYGAFPNCSLLVNNASVFKKTEFPDITEEDFDSEFRINFKVPFFLSRDFAKRDEARLVINLLDARVSSHDTEHFVYTLSKKLLRDFTKMSAKALAPRVRVNGICPGPILPPPGGTVEAFKKFCNELPLEIEGDTDYVVSAVRYLVQNPFVTGECLFVDGGEHLR